MNESAAYLATASTHPVFPSASGTSLGANST